MGVLCTNPWQKMGVSKHIGTYTCCFADTSLAQPGKYSEEIVEADFENRGILWKLWNSKQFQALRHVMLTDGPQKACNLVSSRCYQMLSEGQYFCNAVTDLQKQNVEDMLQSVKDKETIVKHYPVNVDLILDASCNLKCPHCFQQLDGQHVKHLAIEENKEEYLAFFKRATLVALCGGEPTICNNYDFTMSLLKEANAAQILLMTNGHFLIQKVMPNLSLFHAISISVDAADKDTYHLVRPGRNEHYTWDRLMFNINKLSEKPKTYFLDFSFLITGFNYKQMPDMLDLAKKYNVNTVILGEVMSVDYKVGPERQYAYNFVYNNPGLVNEYLEKALVVAKQSGLRVVYQFPSLKKCGVYQPN